MTMSRPISALIAHRRHDARRPPMPIAARPIRKHLDVACPTCAAHVGAVSPSAGCRGWNGGRRPPIPRTAPDSCSALTRPPEPLRSHSPAIPFKAIFVGAHEPAPDGDGLDNSRKRPCAAASGRSRHRHRHRHRPSALSDGAPVRRARAAASTLSPATAMARWKGVSCARAARAGVVTSSGTEHRSPVQGAAPRPRSPPPFVVLCSRRTSTRRRARSHSERR